MTDSLAEPRLQLRAYQHWLALTGDAALPPVAALDLEAPGFADHGLLLRFRPGGGKPALDHVGEALCEECGLERRPRSLDHIPARSILSRLTDHWLQVVAARLPVGFEAEFADAAGRPTAYRGILMPFSSDGDTVDYAWGVINWRKELRKTAQIARLFG